MINPEQIFIFNEDQIFVLNAENEISIKWTAPLELPYFEGHFPGNPVLPAVALLDLSLFVVKLIDCKLKGMFLTIKSAKFSEIIRPLDTLSLRVKRDLTDQSWTLDFVNQNQISVSKLVFFVN